MKYAVALVMASLISSLGWSADDADLPNKAVSITPEFSYMLKRKAASLSYAPGYFTYDDRLFRSFDQEIDVLTGKTRPQNLSGDSLHLFMATTPSGKYALYRFLDPATKNRTADEKTFRHVIMSADKAPDGEIAIDTGWTSDYLYLQTFSSQDPSNELSLSLLQHSDIGSAAVTLYRSRQGKLERKRFIIPGIPYASRAGLLHPMTLQYDAGNSEIEFWHDDKYYLTLTSPRLPETEKEAANIYLTIFDIASEKQVGRIRLQTEFGKLFSYCFSPTKHLFAFTVADKLQIIDYVTRTTVAKGKFSIDPVSIKFAQDGGSLYVLNVGGDLTQWSLDTKAELPHRLSINITSPLRPAKILGLSHDGKWIAVEYLDQNLHKRRIAFWDTTKMFSNNP